MRDIPIASDLSYFVIQKLNRERELLPAQPDQAHQRSEAIRGTKAEILAERLTGESAEAETSLWVRHGN